MKKLLYVTFVDYKERAFLGVIKKIDYQRRAFRKAGMESVLVGQYGNDAIILEDDGSQRIVPASGRPRRAVIADTVMQVIDERSPDYAYIRFQFFCNNVARMTAGMKKHGMKVIMEIPTYPYEGELRLQGLKGIPKLLCDKAFRRLCSRNIDRFAVSGSDTEVMGVPAFTMRNGLCMEDIPLSKYTYSKDRLDILSVSSMMPWHGLERVMDGMAEYYAAGGDREVILHAVGDGVYRSRYEEQAKALGLEDKVIFYGALFGEELDTVWDKCCVGMCALRAHIKDITVGSPLKTVEYIARGIPAVTEMKLWFADEGCDCCMTIPGDETPVDIFAVIDFCDSLLSVDCGKAKLHIRKTAEERCDMSACVRPAVEFFRK